MFQTKPVAYADIMGSEKNCRLSGQLFLFPAQGGTVVWIEIQCMTDDNGKAVNGFRGFHIHSGSECTGNENDPFADAGTHYNPANQEHPNHAGDMPPILISDGYGWMQLFTGRFLPQDVIGHTVVIHSMADDFRTQPAGDSGSKIACGVIKKMEL